LRLAWPLILSNSFWTLQIVLDRVLLSRSNSEAVGAGMAAALLFWTPINLLVSTANYVTTFVAQYVGAGQPHRVGPAVWQSMHFSLLGGLAFLLLVPAAPLLVALGAHSAPLQELETTYFQCLCFAALPTLLTASASSFFAGRGASRTILVINGCGLVVNGGFAYLLIFGRGGFPALGIAGAGWATVLGSSVSAAVGIALMVRPEFRLQFGTGSGWRLDKELFRRLLRFGLPNGIFVAMDILAFTVFLFLVGRLGAVELTASSIAFTLNLVVLLPAVGIGQAVGVLVGQRLGENRPDLAEGTTWTAMRISFIYMTIGGLLYLALPRTLAELFHQQDTGTDWESVVILIPRLLRFVALYTIFDGMNLVFSFALRGAGDTRFVTRMALVLAWPVMVIPTWLTWHNGWGLLWAWTFASSYIILLALTFLWRFQQGQWRSMRVIEMPGMETVPGSSDVATGTALALPESG